MIYRVELRDRDDEFVGILDGRIGAINWGFSPVGGCAEFSFRALSKYCNELQFGANFNVRILKRSDATKLYSIVYQGRIENTSPNLDPDKETIDVSGFGYQSALKDIIIESETYTSTEISVIIKDLLDTYIVPNTDVSYDLADIESTGFTPTTIRFSYVTVQDAIKKLADIAGAVDYGVDANKKFYFLQNSENIGERFIVGKEISNLKITSSSREIGNRIIVLGADISGSKFVYTKDYAKSQAKYGRRDVLIQNSAVKTNDAAEALADARYEEIKGAVDRGSFDLNKEIILEENLPLGLIDIITREVTWDEKEWDTFLWAGYGPFRVRKINYRIIDEDSRLKSSVEFGEPYPDIVENINQLKYSLDNVIQSEG